MPDPNPYAAPSAEIFPVETPPPLVFKTIPTKVGVYRDGNLLVMSKGSTLPDRCLKCNEPADGWKLKRNLAWHSPGFYALILFNLIIYIIVALIVRKKATIFVPLCAEHQRRRRRAIVLGWTFCLLGIGLIVATGAGSELIRGHAGESAGSSIITFGVIGGVVMFLIGVVFAVLASQAAVPKKIDDRYVWLQKVSPELLAQLPPF